MNRTIPAVLVAAGLALTGAAHASAATPNSQLRCFADTPATCTLSARGAHLDSSAGGNAGVYVNAKRTNGKPLSAVDYSFSWTGTPNGGAPRFSIPIDENGDGVTEQYAFLDWASCGNAPSGGTVSTTSSTCAVDYAGVRYANWDAFATADPTYRISRDIPFVIVDVPAVVDVTDVSFAVS